MNDKAYAVLNHVIDEANRTHYDCCGKTVELQRDFHDALKNLQKPAKVLSLNDIAAAL